jgi:Glycosyl transferase family 2
MKKVKKRLRNLQRRTAQQIGRLAVRCFESGHDRAGSELLLVLAELAGRDEQLTTQLAKLLKDYDRQLKSENFPIKLIKANPRNVSIYVLAKEQARKTGSWHIRKKVLEAACKRFPGDPVISADYLASLAIGSDEAAVDRTIALRREPTGGSQSQALNWSHFLWMHGRTGEAVKTLRTVWNPKSQNWRLNVATASLELIDGNPERALEIANSIQPPNDGRGNAAHLDFAIIRKLECRTDLAPETQKALEACRERSQAILRKAPDDSVLSRLNELRRELAECREAVSPDVLNGKGVALLCPIHRVGDLELLLSQLARQKSHSAVACIAVNNTTDIDTEALRRDWNLPLKLHLLDLGSQPNVGAILNRMIEQCDEEFFIRMDSDCFYYDNYARDTIAVAHHNEADIVAKRSRFRLWEESNLLDLEELHLAFQPIEFGQWAGGSTMSFHRRVWESRPFTEFSSLGEDVRFVQQAMYQGFRAFSSDPFNHLIIRKSSKGHHTYEPDTLWQAIGQHRSVMGLGVSPLIEA